MNDAPHIVKNMTNYIEMNELDFIDYNTAMLFLGITKTNDFMEEVRSKRGLYVYDINKYLLSHRIANNSYFDMPFVGLYAINHGSGIYMEKLLRKSELAKMLKYPFSLFNSMTDKCCPYYLLDGSTTKLYRSVEIHYTIYRMSISISMMSKSEEFRSLMAKEDWIKTITFSNKILDKGASGGR